MTDVPEFWYHGSSSQHPGLPVKTQSRFAYYTGAKPDRIKEPMPPEIEQHYNEGKIKEITHAYPYAETRWRIPRVYDGHQNFGHGVYMTNKIDWARKYGDHVIAARIHPDHILVGNWDERDTPGTVMHKVMTHVRAMGGDRMADQAKVFYKAVKKVDRKKKALFIHTGDGEGQLAVYDPGIIHVHGSAEYYPHKDSETVKEAHDSPHHVDESVGLKPEDYADDVKYHSGSKPIGIFRVDPRVLRKSHSDEVSRVPDDVAKNMSYAEPVKATMFSDGEIQLTDGHHRRAAAIQTGKPWINAEISLINARGKHVKNLIANSEAFEKMNESTSLNTSKGSVCPVCDGPTDLKKLSDNYTMVGCRQCETWLDFHNGSVVPIRARRREYTCPQCGSHDAYAHEAHADTGYDEMEGRCRDCRHSGDLAAFNGRTYIDNATVAAMRDDWKKGKNPTDTLYRNLNMKMRARRSLSESTAIEDAGIGTIDHLYPMATPENSNLTIDNDVPNVGSISASLSKYRTLPGIRHVPVSAFGSLAKSDMFYSADDHKRVDKLAAEIKESGHIKPLIVVHDHEGPYVLEGAHRAAALHALGETHVPALVVHDQELHERVRLEETAQGIKRYLDGSHQVVDLGRHGNFHLFSAMPVRTGKHEENSRNLQDNFGSKYTDHLRKVHSIKDYKTNSNGMFLPDSHADEADHKMPEYGGHWIASAYHATQSLETAGLPHQVRHVVIAPMSEGDFSINQNTGKQGDVAGHWHRKEHVIRVKREASFDHQARSRMLTHEWAHAYHDEMSKPQKDAWKRFYQKHVAGSVSGSEDDRQGYIKHFTNLAMLHPNMKAIQNNIKARENYENPYANVFDSAHVSKSRWWHTMDSEGMLKDGVIAQPSHSIKAFDANGKASTISKNRYVKIRNFDLNSDNDRAVLKHHGITTDRAEHYMAAHLSGSKAVGVIHKANIIDHPSAGRMSDDPREPKQYLHADAKKSLHSSSSFMMTPGFKDAEIDHSEHRTVTAYMDQMLKRGANNMEVALDSAHTEAKKKFPTITHHGAERGFADKVISHVKDGKSLEDAVNRAAQFTSVDRHTELSGSLKSELRQHAGQHAPVFSAYGASNDRELFATTVEHLATHPELDPRKPVMKMKPQHRALVKAWKSVIGGGVTTESIVARISAAIR